MSTQIPKSGFKRDVLQAGIDLISTITGMTPPPLDESPNEILEPFMRFAEKVEKLHLAGAPQQSISPIDNDFLSEDDRDALISFSEQCNDSDADGFSIPKESLVRLVEIGCIRHCGFGRYETTRFGDYIVQKVFLQNPQLPLKTISEWNAEHALNHERALAALTSQKVEG